MEGIGIRIRSASGSRHKVFKVSKVTPGRGPEGAGDELDPVEEEGNFGGCAPLVVMEMGELVVTAQFVSSATLVLVVVTVDDCAEDVGKDC